MGIGRRYPWSPVSMIQFLLLFVFSKLKKHTLSLIHPDHHNVLWDKAARLGALGAPIPYECCAGSFEKLRNCSVQVEADPRRLTELIMFSIRSGAAMIKLIRIF